MQKAVIKLKIKTGFTLIELMIVMTLVSVLSAAFYINIRGAIDKADIAEAVSYAKIIADASDLYLTDMGFYPPDVNRGCDPGFLQKFASQVESGGWSCTPVPYIPIHHPANWQDVVNERWLGSYIRDWNKLTPWNGKYDYNLWPDGALRYGECIAPGVYIGIQRDYDNNNPLPASAEQRMLNDGIDKDNVLNGEAQLFVQDIVSDNPVCDPNE